ncbi:MAG: hypothetical protein HKP30_16895, partial [Myxococcales bacterium]|nr:hypothetical protein [Myxococcales bacterium]
MASAFACFHVEAADGVARDPLAAFERLRARAADASDPAAAHHGWLLD